MSYASQIALGDIDPYLYGEVKTWQGNYYRIFSPKDQAWFYLDLPNWRVEEQVYEDGVWKAYLKRVEATKSQWSAQALVDAHLKLGEVAILRKTKKLLWWGKDDRRLVFTENMALIEKWTMDPEEHDIGLLGHAAVVAVPWSTWPDAPGEYTLPPKPPVPGPPPAQQTSCPEGSTGTWPLCVPSTVIPPIVPPTFPPVAPPGPTPVGPPTAPPSVAPPTVGAEAASTPVWAIAGGVAAVGLLAWVLWPKTKLTPNRRARRLHKRVR